MIFSPKQPDDDGTIHTAIEGLRQRDTSGLDADEAEIEQTMRDVADRVAAEPPPLAYNVQTSSAWRILEEQRAHAMDLVRECEAEIAKWTAKRDDAQRAADGCFAGQKAMEG